MSYFLYPESMLSKNKVDEEYELEFQTLKSIGCLTALKLKNIPVGEKLFYRGWMLSSSEYDELLSSAKQQGLAFSVSKDNYYASHYIDNWYDKVSNLTPETLIINRDNLKEKLSSLDLKWDKIFVKDSVKSLSSGKGSIAYNKEDILDIIKNIEKYRGVEGSIVLRKFHDFIDNTEVRYFAINGKVFSPSSYISPIAKLVGDRMKHLPFISIDIIQDSSGKEWLVEIGDGQVSDYKDWDIGKFCQVLRELSLAL